MREVNRKNWQWAWLLLGLVLLAQIITHLAWLPISAHSGQTAIPWMMTQGKTLFGDLLEQHAPATSVVASLAMRLIKLDPILTTRLLNLLLVIALTSLIYVLTRKLAGTVAAVFAMLMWFLWEPVYGNILFYFDSLVGLLVILALATWMGLEGQKRVWYAPLATGLLLGAATIAKQHAWAVVVVFGVWLLLFDRRRLPLFTCGALFFPAVTILIAAAQGNLEAYLYWNWLFNFSGLMDNALPSGSLIRKLILSNLFVPIFMLLAWKRKEHLWLLIGGMWFATMIDLLPRFSDSQAMAHLPLACVISGIALEILRKTRVIQSKWEQGLSWKLALVAGVLLVAGGWGWSSAAPYFSAPLGRAGIPAHDEFLSLAQALQTLSQPNDSLFILPETDSTPQIHMLSGLLPPNTWIKGWGWYFEAPGVLETLMEEWGNQPPTYMVSFPSLLEVGQPGIQELLNFTEMHYELVETVPAITFHGDAKIYRYRG